jgi:hypothetical protein
MDSDNLSAKEACFVFLIEFKSETFQFKEMFRLEKGNYSVRFLLFFSWAQATNAILF